MVNIIPAICWNYQQRTRPANPGRTSEGNQNGIPLRSGEPAPAKSNNFMTVRGEIGIVLVHGIGNQTLGRHVHELITRLSDEKACTGPNRQNLEPRRGATNDVTSVDGAPTYCFNVHGVRVKLREAYWARLSDLDNPPRLQLATYVLSEFIDTISSVWASSPIAWLARRLFRGRTLLDATIFWGTLALAIIAAFLLAVFAQEKSDFAGGLIAIAILLFVTHYAYRSTRYRWLVLRHATHARRVAYCMFYGLIACFLALLQAFLLIFGAEIVLFLVAVPIIVAIALELLAFPFAQLFGELGKLAAMCRIDWLKRWLHRLGWIMIVLPVHTVLQATKASGNLFSIILVEKNIKVKAIAIFWLIGVYFGAYVLVIVSILMISLVIISGVLPFLPSTFGDETITLPVSAVYLLTLKVSLPALDLLLDIGNYHIASVKDRRSYHQVVEQAVQSLRDAECKEIHIIAHSLGSVIVFDWLSSTSSNTRSVRALHTLGSPLNKFWYLDHPRRRRLADAKFLTESQACRWTNYWAFSDVISGPLARYTTAGAQICDTRIPWLGPIFWSHVRYSRNAIVLAGIRDAITQSDEYSDRTARETSMTVLNRDADDKATCKSFDHVFRQEMLDIRDRHNEAGRPKIPEDTANLTPTTALGVTGLACSGGGIRSAAFCLGALRGLQSKETVRHMDYLSTVSGGGYVGTAMTVAMSSSTKELFPFGRLDEERRERAEVRHLRDNSRYLLQNGLPSLASAAVIYLRGVVMSVLVLLPILLIAAALLISLNSNTNALVSIQFLALDLTSVLGDTYIPSRLLCFFWSPWRSSYTHF